MARSPAFVVLCALAFLAPLSSAQVCQIGAKCRLTNGSTKTVTLQPNETTTSTKQSPFERNFSSKKVMSLVDFACTSTNPDIVEVPEESSMLLMPFPNNPDTTFNPGFTIYGGATCKFKNVGSQTATGDVKTLVATQSQPDCESGNPDCVEEEKVQGGVQLCIPQRDPNRVESFVTASCPAGFFSVGVKCSTTNEDHEAKPVSKPGAGLITEGTCGVTKVGGPPAVQSCTFSKVTTTVICVKQLDGCTRL